MILCISTNDTHSTNNTTYIPGIRYCGQLCRSAISELSRKKKGVLLVIKGCFVGGALEGKEE